MTVSLCIRQGLKRKDDSVRVEELDWSAEKKAKHQTPMTCTYGYSHFIHVKTVATGGNTIFKYINYVSIFVATVWKCLFLFWRRGCPNTFVHIMNVHVIVITKVVKPFIKRGWPNTFGNIVYVYIYIYIHIYIHTSNSWHGVCAYVVFVRCVFRVLYSKACTI